MATKLFTNNSFITFHPSYEGGDNCSQCGSYKNIRHAFVFDYESSRLLDWKVDRDFEDHGEALLCFNCVDRFDPDIVFGV